MRYPDDWIERIAEIYHDTSRVKEVSFSNFLDMMWSYKKIREEKEVINGIKR